ncbi:hypothetical protein ABZ826_39210 [Streptomyces sp. NPDC047515]|uniref:hypothetical protein n=1 Tax=Streptomyces sp. NPDC047515 TaxID=3155380 RepID=UPI0034048843
MDVPPPCDAPHLTPRTATSGPRGCSEITKVDKALKAFYALPDARPEGNLFYVRLRAAARAAYDRRSRARRPSDQSS